LQRRCFDNSPNDSQICERGNKAEWYVDDTQNDVIQEAAGSVVPWNWYPEGQTTNRTVHTLAIDFSQAKKEPKIKQ